MNGAPLPSAPSDPSQKDFRKIYTAWLNRAIMAHFPADKDPVGAAFIRASLDFLGSDNPFGVPAKALQTERSFDLSAVTDPGLLFVIGLIEPSSPRQHDAFTKALSLFPGTAYPKFLWFTAASNLGKRDSDTKASADQLKADDDLSLKYLDEGLNDDSFLPGEMSALRWRFDSDSFQDLFSRNQQRVADTFESSARVDPWVKNYVRGVEFVNAAWEARGADWAGNVTPQGWHGFADNLAFARTHLVDSWKHNPHDPAAADEMIMVCMGENEETDTMRTWFDRAVAADFDYIPAYQQYRWGLRPRWLGSYDEMRAFGRECAATARYDTMVPNELIATAIDITDDAQDHGDQFKDPAIASQVLTVLDTYLALPDPCIRVQFSHTMAAVVADKAGRADETQRHMAAINYKPTRNNFLRSMANLRKLADTARAAANPSQTPAAPRVSATPAASETLPAPPKPPLPDTP
jgi:hypothetical protein